MFTIKHLSPHGNESLYEAREVIFLPAPPSPGYSQPAGTSTVSLSNFQFKPADSNAFEELSDGTVYVMNDAGSTVSKYDLGGWYTTLKGETSNSAGVQPMHDRIG